MRNRESLWLIDPLAALTVARMLTRGASTALSSLPKWEAQKPHNRPSPSGGKTAVIPVRGVLTSDGPPQFGTNYRAIANALDNALADSDVDRIVLSIDSPGGEVSGLPEAAGQIAAAAKCKPVHAMVDGHAASAAYWLASQASDITITPSGEVGSVGVRAMHVDISKALENDGVTVTEFSAGKHKTEFSPFSPLSDDTKAYMQARMDSTHQDFINAVNRGRGGRVTSAAQKTDFGGGRMFPAAEALSLGMVDRIVPTREFFKAAVSRAGSNQRARLNLLKARI